MTGLDTLAALAHSLNDKLYLRELELDQCRDLVRRMGELVRQQRFHDVWLSQDQWNQAADKCLKEAGVQ
jgi:hypothetical protein